MEIKTGTYCFDERFGLLVAHWHVVHLVLEAEVTHHLIRSIKHLTEVGEEPKTSANVSQTIKNNYIHVFKLLIQVQQVLKKTKDLDARVSN